jgi:hypothetical protein
LVEIMCQNFWWPKKQNLSKPLSRLHLREDRTKWQPTSLGFAMGWNLYCPAGTKAKFIIKSSLFIQKPNIVRQTGTKAQPCFQPIALPSASLLQNPML